MAIRISADAVVPYAILAVGCLAIGGFTLLVEKMAPIVSKKFLETANYFLTSSDSKKPLPTVTGFQTIQSLQDGANSHVYLIKRESDGEEFVCKEISEPSSLSEKKALLRETLILQQLKHPNIVDLEDLIGDHGTTKLLMKYRPESVDLNYFFSDIPLSTNLAMKILGQLVMTLKYCHNQNVVHRDLKPENILIDRTSHKATVIDFGLSRYAPQDGRPIFNNCGTLQYLSPEFLSHAWCDPKKSDIWALGVVLYFMATRTLPFHHANRDVLTERIKKGKYQIPNGVNDQMKDLIKGILNPDPSKRFSLDQIVQHPLSQKYQHYFVDLTPQSKQTVAPQTNDEVPFSRFELEEADAETKQAIIGDGPIPLYKEV